MHLLLGVARGGMVGCSPPTLSRTPFTAREKKRPTEMQRGRHGMLVELSGEDIGIGE